MKQKTAKIRGDNNICSHGRILILVALLSSLFCLTPSLSQAIVINDVANDGVTLAQITAALQGPGVTISNLVITNNGCANRDEAVGLFSQGTTATGAGPVLGDANGVVLSTGPLKPGDPLVSTNSQGDWTNGLCGNVTDPDMVALEGQTANGEYIAIEFDIVPTQPIMTIPFQFGSEEFPEYVCSAFNDVTGIFVSGPGINGPYSNNAENFAKTPGGDLTSINWVNTGVVGAYGNIGNCGSLTNTAYYTDNSNGDPLGGNATVATTNQNLEMDGWTNYIYQPISVTPGATYHVKAAIADAGDRQWDSAVFFHLIFSSGTLPGFDFGDAPNSYRTLTSSGGPRHGINSNLFIGAGEPDNEVTGQPSIAADGDDNATSDDEDGVSSIPNLNASATSYSVDVTVSNTTGSNAKLFGWIDFNGNGSFDTAEGVSVTVPNGTSGGTSTLTWSGLSGLVAGTSYARFRLTTDTAITTATPGGSASDGEVEDYTLNITASNLSTSTKTVADQDGGDVEFGNQLLYTITLIESGGITATNVQVTDDIPANVDSFTVTGIPSGATDFSTPNGTGANGSGFLDIRNISIPANGSATITFEVRVSGSDGNSIDNTATIINTSGTGTTTATAPSLIIAGSSLPASGDKFLYLDADLSLSRTPSTLDRWAGYVAIGRDSTTTWTLTPALTKPVTLGKDPMPTTIPVQLWLSSNRSQNYDIPLTLRCGAVTVATSTETKYINAWAINGPFTWNLTLNAEFTCPAGSSFELDITNQTASRTMYVFQYTAPDNSYSYVSLPSKSVINVDSITFHDAAYPTASPITQATGGDTVYIRAEVSDPFGDYDITDTYLDLTDGSGSPIITNQLLSAAYEVTESPDDPATRTFEYAYTLPALPVTGYWTATVTSNEGTEGTVSDYGLASFEVPAVLPSLTVLKSADRTTVNPGEVITYTITTMNSGAGPATTVMVSDNLSPYVGMILDYDGVTPPYEPFDFVPATSGLTFGTPVYYDSGGIFTPNFAAGEDNTVIRWEIPMNGSFNPGPGSEFTLRFKVRVK